jgi:hypothetical protein
MALLILIAESLFRINTETAYSSQVLFFFMWSSSFLVFVLCFSVFADCEILPISRDSPFFSTTANIDHIKA